MDALFLRQVWAGNDAMLQDLARLAAAPAAPRASRSAARALHYFLINKGPWSRSITTSRSCPARRPSPRRRTSIRRRDEGRGREVDRRRCPGDAKAAATGFFTTIRRGDDGTFVVVPYSIEYQGELARAAELLREAAQLTARADAEDVPRRRAPTRSSANDYYDSDVAWMELDGAIEPTIGPYEVYEDEWFNYKAAFEAFITVRDEAETTKLQEFSDELQEHREQPADRSEVLATRSSARSRRSASSTRSSRPATATAACRPPPSTCPTTSASCRRRAPSA